jgi:hypothetical protein
MMDMCRGCVVIHATTEHSLEAAIIKYQGRNDRVASSRERWYLGLGHVSFLFCELVASCIALCCEDFMCDTSIGPDLVLHDLP